MIDLLKRIAPHHPVDMRHSGRHRLDAGRSEMCMCVHQPGDRVSTAHVEPLVHIRRRLTEQAAIYAKFVVPPLEIAHTDAVHSGRTVSRKDIEDMSHSAPSCIGGGVIRVARRYDVPMSLDTTSTPSSDDAVGVGPHSRPWPEGDQYDPELLADGDRRNVVDGYRYWSHEAIVADLDRRRHPFHVAIENWQHDFNIGTVVRNANAFLAEAVHIIGNRRWNRRGAMVTDRYQHVFHHATFGDFLTDMADLELTIVGIDNLPGSRPIEQTMLPEAAVLVFGQEGPGLSAAAHAACDVVCSISQFGSTRSINAGVASGIAMHTWIRQHVAEGT